MTTQQTDALQCAADLEYSIPRHRIQDAFILNAYKALKMVRTQHARITELESQLAQRFDAADMATAAAQGFRDGVASVAASAESEPVATIKSWTNGSYWRNYNVVFHRDDLPVGTDLYTHPSPPEGMAGWQPIETAPKDGQAILVTDGMNCYCVEWDEEFDWWTVDDNKLGPFRLRGSAPTHWRELPPPPSSAQREVSNANS